MEKVELGIWQILKPNDAATTATLLLKKITYLRVKYIVWFSSLLAHYLLCFENEKGMQDS